ncbi:MAG: serine/threonine-protein kinase [Planctomycetota bacterium]
MKTLCERCGAGLPPVETPGGLCPRCLVEAAMAAEDSVASGEGGFHAGEPPPAVDELAPHFPNLEIEALIGRGGMGIVYRAVQRGLERPIALKILGIDAAEDPSFAARFTREARALARLDHPNLVTVHEVGQAGPYWFIAMELADGASLRELIRGGEVDAPQALAIVRQICDALEFAHSEGVVHRDIKPENILIDAAGRVKILDFGLAKLVGKAAPAERLTRSRQVMGTPHYMAPEQLGGSPEVDQRADIYSLGVVFYELLTGELPVGRFQPPSQKVEVDVRLDRVVLRALESEPERRYQRASEIRTDVDLVEGRAAPATADAMSTGEPAKPATSDSWLPWIVIPAILVPLGALLIFGVLWLLAYAPVDVSVSPTRARPVAIAKAVAPDPLPRSPVAEALDPNDAASLVLEVAEGGEIRHDGESLHGPDFDNQESFARLARVLEAVATTSSKVPYDPSRRTSPEVPEAAVLLRLKPGAPYRALLEVIRAGAQPGVAIHRYRVAVLTPEGDEGYLPITLPRVPTEPVETVNLQLTRDSRSRLAQFRLGTVIGVSLGRAMEHLDELHAKGRDFPLRLRLPADTTAAELVDVIGHARVVGYDDVYLYNPSAGRSREYLCYPMESDSWETD